MAFLSEGERGGAERRELVSELLVGETSFFRTPVLFQAFEKAILPGLREQGFDPLPIWCAGCATGEEAYSVAIAALEGSGGLHAVPVRVRGTDLHRRFIDTAREGIYPGQALRNLPGRIRETWFTPMKDGRYRVTDAVRQLVDFEELNLIDFLSDPLPSALYAAIFCRNVMIYFRSDTTRRLVERFHEVLEGGALFLGHSETLWGISEAFRLEQTEKIFYYRKSRASNRPPRPAVAPRSSGSSAPRRRVPRVETPPPPRCRFLSRDEAGPFGGAAGRRGAIDEAVAMCRQAAALDPGCPEAEYLMAFLLRGHERHAEALYHAERALERDPQFVFADMEAAECLCGMGEGREAALRWKGILRAIPRETCRSPSSVGAEISPRCCANTCSPDCRVYRLANSLKHTVHWMNPVAGVPSR